MLCEEHFSLHANKGCKYSVVNILLVFKCVSFYLFLLQMEEQGKDVTAVSEDINKIEATSRSNVQEENDKTLQSRIAFVPKFDNQADSPEDLNM